jgi:[ribosomal protein S18]-alanine N-acetyltransferase
MSALYVRHAVDSDLDAIVVLERSTENAPHWPPATYSDILRQQDAAPRRCLIVAHIDGSLAGFAVGLMHPTPLDAPDRIAELESVAVAASARRAGVGRALCVAVLDWCSSKSATEVVLEVRAASAAAIALYSGLGFTQVGRRPRYYHDPDDDALMMRLRMNRISPEVI